VPELEAGAMRSIALRLKSVLEREPGMRASELEAAIAEKERLVAELESSLRLGEPGALDRVKSLEGLVKPLAAANMQAFRFNRILLRLSKIGSRKPVPATARRVDLIS
jgi:hypothetical protein